MVVSMPRFCRCVSPDADTQFVHGFGEMYYERILVNAFLPDESWRCPGFISATELVQFRQLFKSFYHFSNFTFLLGTQMAR